MTDKIDRWPDRTRRTDLEYGYDWSPRLDPGETIVARDVFTNYDLDIYREYVTENVQTIWIRGGSVGSAQVTFVITTNRGRTYDRLFRIDTTG